ncbi:MAG TPA: hypothetical protein VHL98_12155 [Microvirga sp.]|nr:hypothetical protein [Microvirga sp.]
MTTFVLLPAAGVTAGATAPWRFVFPGNPGEAIADAVTVGAVASYVEFAAMRLGM